MLHLRDRVSFTPPRGFRQEGEVRGITRQARPLYDILADDGRWYISVPADCVELAEKGRAA